MIDQNEDEAVKKMAKNLLPPGMYEEFLKVMEDEERNNLVCKRLLVKTDTEGQDREFIEAQNFTVSRGREDLVVKTYYDKERKQMASKTIMNFKFIISIEYTY